MNRRFPHLTVLVAVQLSICSISTRADEQQVLEQLQTSREKYRTAEKWSERREELRREFLIGARLWPLPERPPVKAIVHGRREHGDYAVENVALETLPGFYCTGNLYRPLGRKDLGPAILCPHGHFRPLGRYRENHQIRCAHLARMGATVFSYSMVGWQDSQQTTHDDPLVLALQTWNSLRVVDFLTGLERVDAERVGITGASGGGTQTFFLALIDERIKASAPLVIVYPWTAPQGCLCEGGLPVMQAAGTNAIELAAAAAPRPQLLISVGNDPTQKFPEIGFPFIQHMYQVAGAKTAVKNIHYADEAHDFGPSKRRDVYAFFAQHLNMKRNAFNPAGEREVHDLELIPEDLSRIKIETPQQLAAFNAAHPLPDHAVQGSQAVDGAFHSHLAELRRAQSERDAALRIDGAPRATYSFQEASEEDERLIFTPAGFDRVGVPQVASGADTGTLRLTVRDRDTGRPIPCRVNVVGPDGNYYEPHQNPLKRHSLTGVWPQSGWGNRQSKAPVRYFGRFFYCAGQAEVKVPAGVVRVEVWKGYEYRPTVTTVSVLPGREKAIQMELDNAVRMSDRGYWSGDPHIHIQRCDEADDERILDLMQAEDIRFGTILAYNNPAGPYSGFMNRMEAPQLRGLGPRSIRSRGDYAIVSGEEYRTAAYGHLNLFMLDELIMPDQSFNADLWPPYGQIGTKAREAGGYSFYAHGGYAKEIYADVVQGTVDGVELLQFGVYRGIGLIDWYHMLNTGFRVPATGACDYPACRKLGDCKTYAWSEQKPTMRQWLQALVAGRSFMTTGPLLLFEVDGHRPGTRIDKPAAKSARVTIRLRVRSEVAPVTNIQLIANGRVLDELRLPKSAGQGQGQGQWIDIEREVELTESAWIAARAYSLSRLGTPDAESHTNPVYVYLNGRAPYDRQSLDALVSAIDGQIAVHEKRKFSQQAQIIAYFERSRDILMKIRAAGGVPSTGHPSEIAQRDPTLFDPGAREHSDEQLRAFLKPIPPRPIVEALRSFETQNGFEMQLVAREPLVTDPIAAAFDEHGNLYVCEMTDYPYKPGPGNKPLGSIRLLRDTDGDGVFDESHVFADQLLWAGGVAPWKGGIFAAAPPDIWYLKDTDGDFQADVRQRVFTGFGTANQQAMVNNLKWGLDHKIYGSTAHNGGTIRSAGDPQSPGISVNGRDFRFDPVTLEFETITGTVQFGNTFDDWGNRFLCAESQPLQHAVLPQHYLERNPFLAVPRAIVNIAPGPVPSFRISPLERWRQIRSSRRIAHGQRAPTSAGASHHVLDAAAGVTVYRGGAYPREYYGDVFIGGAQNNLIHRRKLVSNGVTFSSQRVEQRSEFVRSSDNWFRPVNFVNAPDGTLYVLDMSREILETIHVPLDVTRFIDFKHGRDHGRIYRIAPPQFEYPGAPQLSGLSSAQLVARLESPHGWHRETAQRLLFERQDASAVPALRDVLYDSRLPQARLHALYLLRGLKRLSDEDIRVALADDHAAVREHAMRMAETRLNDAPELLSRVLGLSSDRDPRIQLQLAFSLGASRDDRAAAMLAQMAARHADDTWIRTAVLSSTNGLADRVFVELLGDTEFSSSPSGIGLLERLLTVVGARGKPAEVSRVVDAIATHPATAENRDRQLRLAAVLGDALGRSGKVLAASELPSRTAAQFLDQLIKSAARDAGKADLAVAQRQAAIRLLSGTRFETSGEQLAGLLDPGEPEPVQLAAVRSLAAYSEPAVASILLANWRTASPAVRTAMTEALLARTDRTIAFLTAAERGEISAAGVPLSRRSLLLEHEDPTVRQLGQRVFGNSADGSRAEVIAAYESALALDSDQKRGEAVFRRECSACHKIGGQGYAIGPDLTSSASRDARALLVHVLDPNRYVLPNYEQYVCIDTQGRVYTGMMIAQTATSITLRREQNKTDTILRGQIEELVSSGKSMMPEGLEKKLTQQDMADLIAWLQSAQKQKPTGDQPLHIGTLPGLIEPDSDSPE